jgi:hypothetical protein
MPGGSNYMMNSGNDGIYTYMIKHDHVDRVEPKGCRLTAAFSSDTSWAVRG